MTSGLGSMREQASSQYDRMLVQKENATAWLENRPGRSSVHAGEKEWSIIWQLKVPSKIKVFL